MNTHQFREYLNTVEPDTWAKMGKFLVNYVSDEEIQRWIIYWNSLNEDINNVDSPYSFSQVLQYFLESIFRNADKYHNLPKILKDFVESSDEDLLYLGTRLNKAIKAYENQEIIIAKLRNEDLSMKPFCNYCGCYNLLDEIKTLIWEDVF